MAFFVGLILAMPVVLYQLWAFVAPGLYRHEKRFAVPLLLSSVILFYLGVAFAYLFVFSLGMTALLIAVGLLAGYGAQLPRGGRWTVWIKRASGVVLLGMAEYYFIQMGKVS